MIFTQKQALFIRKYNSLLLFRVAAVVLSTLGGVP